MWFLIKFDRISGERTQLEQFEDDEYSKAYARRVTLDIEALEKGDTVEVVLLQAASIEALQTTHRRYFASSEQLAKQLEDPRRLGSGPEPTSLHKGSRRPPSRTD